MSESTDDFVFVPARVENLAGGGPLLELQTVSAGGGPQQLNWPPEFEEGPSAFELQLQSALAVGEILISDFETSTTPVHTQLDRQHPINVQSPAENTNNLMLQLPEAREERAVAMDTDLTPRESPVAGTTAVVEMKHNQNLMPKAGYDYRFQDEEFALEYQCIICLSVARNPQQAACCGATFCDYCIKRAMALGRGCPICSKNDVELISDKAQRQKINKLKVHCPVEGCEWIVELADVETHRAKPHPTSPPPTTPHSTLQLQLQQQQQQQQQLPPTNLSLNSQPLDLLELTLPQQQDLRLLSPMLPEQLSISKPTRHRPPPIPPQETSDYVNVLPNYVNVSLSQPSAHQEQCNQSTEEETPVYLNLTLPHQQKSQNLQERSQTLLPRSKQQQIPQYVNLELSASQLLSHSSSPSPPPGPPPPLPSHPAPPSLPPRPPPLLPSHPSSSPGQPPLPPLPNHPSPPSPPPGSPPLLLSHPAPPSSSLGPLPPVPNHPAPPSPPPGPPPPLLNHPAPPSPPPGPPPPLLNHPAPPSLPPRPPPPPPLPNQPAPLLNQMQPSSDQPPHEANVYEIVTQPEPLQETNESVNMSVPYPPTLQEQRDQQTLQPQSQAPEDEYVTISASSQSDLGSHLYEPLPPPRPDPPPVEQERTVYANLPPPLPVPRYPPAPQLPPRPGPEEEPPPPLLPPRTETLTTEQPQRAIDPAQSEREQPPPLPARNEPLPPPLPPPNEPIQPQQVQTDATRLHPEPERPPQPPLPTDHEEQQPQQDQADLPQNTNESAPPRYEDLLIPQPPAEPQQQQQNVAAPPNQDVLVIPNRNAANDPTQQNEEGPIRTENVTIQYQHGGQRAQKSKAKLKRILWLVLSIMAAVIWFLFTIPLSVAALLNALHEIEQGRAPLIPSCHYSVVLLLLVLLMQVVAAAFVVYWFSKCCKCARTKKASRVATIITVLVTILYTVIIIGFAASVFPFVNKSKAGADSENTMDSSSSPEASRSFGQDFLVKWGQTTNVDSTRSQDPGDETRIRNGYRQATNNNPSSDDSESDSGICIATNSPPFLFAVFFLFALLLFLTVIAFITCCDYHYKRNYNFFRYVRDTVRVYSNEGAQEATTL